ncbi:MAG: DNA repair protein RecO [Nitrospirae bacterium]|nr:MAG: DNA repair protein RecO [Nitrospirota bacterium]
MALITTPAIVLHCRRWGEADRLVSLYTERMGKVRGIARGARRMKSRFGSSLEPFTVLDVTFFDKGQEAQESLVCISQADIREHFPVLREDLGRMMAAASMVNLVLQITVERDPGPKLFTTLREGLRSLQDGADPSLASVVVQLQVLAHSGFRPQFDHCVVCESVPSESTIRFSPRAGGVVCEPCARRSQAACVMLSPGARAYLVQAKRWLVPRVTRLKASGPIRREVEAVLEAYLREILGRRLPSLGQQDPSWAVDPDRQKDRSSTQVMSPALGG